MKQRVIDKAVKIATREAMNNRPVSSIQWVAPITGSDPAIGTFVISYADERNGSAVPWWR